MSLPVRWFAHAVHVAGVASVAGPAAAALLSGAPGWQASTDLQQAFATACPLSDGISPGSLAWRWLLSEPANQVFGDAEDPWLCGAAHASTLLEAQAALLVAVGLILLVVRSPADARPLLLFWTAICFGCHIISASQGRWLPDRFSHIISSCQAGVGISALIVYFVLQFCASLGSSLLPPSCLGSWDTNGDEGEELAEVAVPDSGKWMPGIFRDSGGAEAEQLLTDQLQAAFERRERDIQRARVDERSAGGSRVSVTASPALRFLARGLRR